MVSVVSTGGKPEDANGAVIPIPRAAGSGGGLAAGSRGAVPLASLLDGRDGGAVPLLLLVTHVRCVALLVASGL